VDDLWAPKSEGVGLSVRAISFQDFQPMWSWSTNVTDGQTDRETTCDGKTAICSTIVHRAVKSDGTEVVKKIESPMWLVVVYKVAFFLQYRALVYRLRV